MNGVRNNTTTTGREKLAQMESKAGITNSSGITGATPNQAVTFLANNRAANANNSGSRNTTRPGSRNTTAGTAGTKQDLDTNTLLRNLSMKNINEVTGNAGAGAGSSSTAVPGVSKKRNASVANLGGAKKQGNYGANPSARLTRRPGEAAPPPAKQPPLLPGQGHLSIAEQAYIASQHERRRMA